MVLFITGVNWFQCPLTNRFMQHMYFVCYPNIHTPIPLQRVMENSAGLDFASFMRLPKQCNQLHSMQPGLQSISPAPCRERQSPQLNAFSDLMHDYVILYMHGHSLSAKRSQFTLAFQLYKLQTIPLIWAYCQQQTITKWTTQALGRFKDGTSHSHVNAVAWQHLPKSSTPIPVFRQLIVRT